MRYLIRSIKYFFYFCLLFTAIIGILILIGAAEADIDTLFVGGKKSLWQIALLFAVISAIYPKVSYIKRNASIPGSWDEIRGDVKAFMESRHYMLEKEDEGSMSFRHTGFMSRLSRMFEDRIVITPTFGGVILDGHRKDIMRLGTGLENALQPKEE